MYSLSWFLWTGIHEGLSGSGSGFSHSVVSNSLQPQGL